ncbi:hypothetical protein FJT64_002495 [Amphibalanus amphitrite]|uniref:Uncharacterized protein n=1 Tax=Amphibalanus amphitrite TaxID=1232801 RepID=A0A6A4WI46_AMPAM|nr:uncharacterized protein LOC122380221 [Amphibalanus amphitrite]KAF0305743.1 hypothetical protein FJT64_002495 [Amphibalanus amphitrite]
MLFSVLLAVCVSAVSGAWFDYPLHASCHADWTVGMSCVDAQRAIVEQMKSWAGPEGCQSGGQKCLYKYLSTEDGVVKGTHTTPVSHYVDDLEFTFDDADDGSCTVHGFSTSETFYAVLDMSTNYCNLRNLLAGSGLDRSNGFSERTSNSICTQRSSANCDVY